MSEENKMPDYAELEALALLAPQPVAQQQEPALPASPIPWAKHWHHRDGVLIAESTPIARAVFDMVGLYCTSDSLLDWICLAINSTSAQPSSLPGFDVCLEMGFDAVDAAKIKHDENTDDAITAAISAVFERLMPMVVSLQNERISAQASREEYEAQPCPAQTPKAAALPPIDPKNTRFSVNILARSPCGFELGRYDFYYKEWNNGSDPFHAFEW